MRVLFVIPGKETGNSMIFAKRQIDFLKKLGVVSLTFYLESRLNPAKLFSEYLRFRKCLNRFNPEIIHCQYGTMTAFFGAFSSIKPLVITFQGSDLNFLKSENFFLEIFRKILSQVAALRAASIICVSERLKEKLWWRKMITSVVPAGVNESFFQPINYNDARKKLNIAEGEKIILFNHNNTPVKRLDIAEEAVSIVKHQIPSARLKILNGNASDDEIVLLFNACDCLLLCSDSEGSPMMVKEAMACNLPIVSTDVGDVKKNIEATFPGVITEQNPQMLAEGIMEIFKMNSRSNGREIFLVSELTEKRTSEKILNIYSNILKR